MGHATAYHAKFFAYDLQRQASGDDVDRLSLSLFDACVDLNPHQVEAAHFAFRSPLSKGVLLADEVGLGKTIEAGFEWNDCVVETILNDSDLAAWQVCLRAPAPIPTNPKCTLFGKPLTSSAANLKRPDDTWKVCLLEEDCHKRMCAYTES